MKDFKILLFYPNEPMVGIVPSNLAILSACLKCADFQIKLFDCTTYRSVTGETQEDVRTKLGLVKKTDIDNYTQLKDINIYDDFVKVVNEYKPNLIAFTVVDSTIKFSLSFVEKIRDKGIFTVFGGVGATFNYEKILKTKLVDFVCVGEGEEAIVELCENLYKKQLGNIRNIYYIDPFTNEIEKNPLRPLIDLETLPMPDFSIYEDWRFYRPFMGKVKRMLQLDFDRGCQHGCTYCAAPGLRKVFIKENCGRYYRVKSNDKMFLEMKYLIEKYKLDFVWISSETLLDLPLEQFKEFAERYKKEINLPMWCQSRLDTFTEEKTKILAEIGCQNVSIGLEHGSELIRKKILNKHISNDVIIDAVKMMAKYNIFPTFNNMLGLPDETRENVFETVKLNKKLTKILNGKHNLNIFTFIPFSGTKLRQVCIEKGYIKEDEDLPPSFFNESMLNMSSLSKKEIKGLEKTLALYILLPKSYWSDIKIAEQDNEEGNVMFEKLIKLIKK
jgi:anaerobic magnesium-protoporphyrin IX monomethyl ester cyclase